MTKPHTLPKPESLQTCLRLNWFGKDHRTGFFSMTSELWPTSLPEREVLSVVQARGQRVFEGGRSLSQRRGALFGRTRVGGAVVTSWERVTLFILLIPLTFCSILLNTHMEEKCKGGWWCTCTTVLSGWEGNQRRTQTGL